MGRDEMPRKNVRAGGDLAQYLDEIVDPTVADFEANPTSRRHAFLACVVIAHAADYSAGSREEHKRQSKDFRLVDQVAHALKHVRSSLHQSQVIVRPPAVWGQAVWDLSPWDDAMGGVTIDNDVNVDLLEAAKKAVLYVRGLSPTNK
jgi:hypothetical protein